MDEQRRRYEVGAQGRGEGYHVDASPVRRPGRRVWRGRHADRSRPVGAGDQRAGVRQSFVVAYRAAVSRWGRVWGGFLGSLKKKIFFLCDVTTARQEGTRGSRLPHDACVCLWLAVFYLPRDNGCFPSTAPQSCVISVSVTGKRRGVGRWGGEGGVEGGAFTAEL